MNTDEDDTYKRTQWEIFLARFETYIKAVIQDASPDADCGDAVRLTELRNEFITTIMTKEFDL